MLDKINKPEDIKKLSFHELSILAEEVRKRIITVTSKNGGHVASSLGATDFIIALLKVFNPLHDNIIFDVGHQAYAYKILTGRNESFDTLRTLGGISGFSNIFESKYDSFTVGHASTSISATLGIAVAKEMMSQKGTTIAVIGDGALTGGMAFEGLNQAGHLNKNMIVVLNDNEMSISKNVGALQNYLTNVLVSKSYNSLKKQVWNMSQTFPDRIRRAFISGAQKIEESLMNIVVPNIIFEDLGFKYVGPINGHDIPRICRVFKKVKENITGPVLIHLITQKGKGYNHAESDSSKYHGVGPYCLETGVADTSTTKSWSMVFGDKLCELASKNEKIVAITAAMSDGTGLQEFSEKFEKRFFDVGISEQHAVTFAAGLAIKELRPYVAIYSTFLQRAIDQIIHDVALQKLPVVFCIDRSGLVGEDGATHQGVFDLSYLQFIPNMTIISPAFKHELEWALEWCLQHNDGPVAIRYPRGSTNGVPPFMPRSGDLRSPQSRSDDLRSPQSRIDDLRSPHQRRDTVGTMTIEDHRYESPKIINNIVITGVGNAYHIATELAHLITQNHPSITPTLINPLFIKPYDKELFDTVYENAQYHLVIEENAEIGGFASRLALDYSLSNCKTVPSAIPDIFIEHGKIEQLREAIELTAEKIYKKNEFIWSTK